MATSRKGSTTPKELEEDAGGLVAGGGPDLSGTASQPAQPDSPKPRARATGTGTGTGTRKAADERKAAARQPPGSAPPPKPKAKPAVKGSARSPGAPAPSTEAGADGGPGQGGDERSADGILPPAAGARAAEPYGRMSDEERQRRIAERAYRKAQERGFAGDRQLEDWLEAEREHDQSV
jgi:hypothetical protein